MKKLIIISFVIVSIFSLTGCGITARKTSTEEIHQQSTFKQNFSIGTIIEAHEDLLIEGPRALSGMEAGPPEPFEQSHEYMNIQVVDENITPLLEEIQTDTEKALRDSNTEIVGTSGSDSQADPISYFSYNYRDGQFYGTINVWSVRGEGEQLILIAQITESKKAAGQ